MSEQISTQGVEQVMKIIAQESTPPKPFVTVEDRSNVDVPDYRKVSAEFRGILQPSATTDTGGNGAEHKTATPSLGKST